MELTFAPKGRLQIDDARLVYKNFRGEGGKYNREGDRNFAVVIPNEEMAEELKQEGWNVKIKEPKEAGDMPFMYLPVKIKFREYGPNVYLVSGQRRNRITEETVAMLDNIEIANADLDIRPYDWEVSGSTGRTAYLEAMEVTQNIDRFAQRYAEEEYPEE